MSITAAIDPGVSGAIAIFDGTTLATVTDMPVAHYVGWAHNLADGNAVAELVEAWAVDRVILEVIQPRPGNGMKSVAASAASWGMVLGALHNVRTVLVAPQTWTKALGVGSDKSAHRSAARNLFGGDWFDRVKDDGRADAALIGHWWLTKGPR